MAYHYPSLYMTCLAAVKILASKTKCVEPLFLFLPILPRVLNVIPIRSLSGFLELQKDRQVN